MKHNLNTSRSRQVAGTSENSTATGRSFVRADEGTNLHIAMFPFKQGMEVFADVRNFTNAHRA